MREHTCTLHIILYTDFNMTLHRTAAILQLLDIDVNTLNLPLSFNSFFQKMLEFSAIGIKLYYSNSSPRNSRLPTTYRIVKLCSGCYTTRISTTSIHAAHPPSTPKTLQKTENGKTSNKVARSRGFTSCYIVSKTGNKNCE